MRRFGGLTGLIVGLVFYLCFPAGIAGADKKIDAGLLGGLRFRSVGPAFMSGRISDLAVNPSDRRIWYVAVGSGGVWKTVNGGTTFFPLFDEQASYSIGCITIDPRNPQVVWVGSGENVSGRHVGYGDGVYRSSDGGRTWQNMGLKKSEHIDKIIIDPRDSDTVYVAAEGPLWSSGGERGVFKSVDGGKTWHNSLVVDADTGVTDLVMDPQNPLTLYAAAHQRRRHVSALVNGGPGSGIYKSLDGGQTWVELTTGLPTEDMGQIALAVSPQRPQVVYASVETAIRRVTFYRSEDGGSSWQKGASYVTPGTGPHYYQELYADPHRFDRIYSMEINILVSNDGGFNWDKIPEANKHGDNHALAFDSRDPDHLLCGSDGGIYETRDLGKSWRFISNLPVTQFYRIALDNAQPFYHIVGGTQDNCTQYGPSRTIRREGVFSSDWVVTMGGDGYSCQIDPEDPDTLYCEAQVGEMIRYSAKTGESVMIKPFTGPEEDIPRWNWDSPVLISPHNSRRLYFASQRLYRSDDRGDSWRPVSGDLSKGINRLGERFMGRSWGADAVWDNDAMSYYGNVVTIAESPLQEGLIYCGTDDGLIQVTRDGGKTWLRHDRFPGIPDGTFVAEIMASKHDKETVYALFNNHQRGDFKPYLLKSADAGNTWQNLAAGLPDRHVLWTIEQDPVKKELLFLGSEFGVYLSLDEGKNWLPFKGGMPVIAVRDIKIQARESDLVCATFGRGIYILDDYSSLRGFSPSVFEQDFWIFPPRDGQLYTPVSPTGGSLGDTVFAAPNPPYGVTFTYHLKEAVKTSREVRNEEEKTRQTARQEILFPGWDRLRQESRELPVQLEFVIEDDEGRAVRRLSCPAEKGLHRLTWDLRLPSQRPVDLDPPKPSPFTYSGYGEGRGPLALPGEYRVSVYLLKGLERQTLAEKKPFRLAFLDETLGERIDLPGLKAYRREALALNLKVTAISEIVGAMGKDIEALRLSRPRALHSEPGLEKDILRLRESVLDLSEQLFGDPVRAVWGEPRHGGLLERVWMVLGRGGSEWAPLTSGQLALIKRVSDEVAVTRQRLKVIMEQELPDVMKRAQAAGYPWVPGFGLYDLLE